RGAPARRPRPAVRLSPARRTACPRLDAVGSVAAVQCAGFLVPKTIIRVGTPLAVESGKGGPHVSPLIFRFWPSGFFDDHGARRADRCLNRARADTGPCGSSKLAGVQ